MSQSCWLNRARILILVILSVVGESTANADYAFIAYYHSPGAEVSQLTLNANNTVKSAAVFGKTNTFNSGSGFQGEGITFENNLGGAHPSQIYIASPSDGTVKSFDPNGTLISNNILKSSTGGAFTLAGDAIAGTALSSDGRDLYVAASSGNTTGIWEFNAVTGKQVGYNAFTGAHDVTFHNGYLYASAYLTASNAGVYRFNADLSGQTQIIAGGNNNLYHATGMAFVGNNLYVGNAGVNSSSNVANFVSEYTVGGTTATFVQTYMDASKIINPFGIAAGPDGNIYVSSLGDLGSANGQITKLDVSKTPATALSTWLANGTAGTANAPKYLSFESEAVSLVPEPSSFVLMGLGLAGTALVGRARRRPIVA